MSLQMSLLLRVPLEALTIDWTVFLWGKVKWSQATATVDQTIQNENPVPLQEALEPHYIQEVGRSPVPLIWYWYSSDRHQADSSRQ